jgi:hypothetical protein
MARMTLGKQLAVSFGSLALVSIGLGATGLWQASRMYADAERVANRDMEIVKLAERVRFGVEEMRSTVRASFIDGARGDNAGIDGRSERTDAIRRGIKDTGKLLGAVAPQHSDDVEQIAKLADEYVSLTLPVFEALRAGDMAKATDVVKAVTSVGDRMQEIVRGVITETQALRAEMATSWWQARAAILTLFALAILVCIGTLVAVRRITARVRASTNELRGAAEQVSQAASQVATAAQQLSQGATEQAAALEESSASMEEMGSMTQRNAQQSDHAAELMTAVDVQVQHSNALLQDMTRSMAEIRESSTRVGKIIKTIDEIAFQTNILALNAAVEAARAGEAGAGFAVVADEVRSLAQRAAEAANNTTALIEESTQRADVGSRKVTEVSEAIQKVTASIAQVGDIARQVSAASREQAQGVSQVSTAIQQMEKVTQTNAATAEESAAASEELNAQAETALSLVRELDAVVGS